MITLSFDKSEVGKWFCEMGRPMEPCIFSHDIDGDKCVLCGQRCIAGMQQSHPGKMITLDGWFILSEFHAPGALTLTSLTIPNSYGLENVPIIVTECVSVGGRDWKYTFHAEAYA